MAYSLNGRVKTAKNRLTNNKVTDIEFHDLMDCCDGADGFECQTMARVNFKTQSMRLTGSFFQTLEFCGRLSFIAPDDLFTIGAGVKLNDGGTERGGRGNLVRLCINKQ